VQHDRLPLASGAAIGDKPAAYVAGKESREPGL
jgi:hypothetical protein